MMSDVQMRVNFMQKIFSIVSCEVHHDNVDPDIIIFIPYLSILHSAHLFVCLSLHVHVFFCLWGGD